MCKKTMIIDDINIHLMACKNQEYKTRVWERFRALVHYLNQMGYTNINLVNELETRQDQFKLNSEQLNEEGMMWIKNKYQRWLNKLDRSNIEYDFNKYLESIKNI